MWYLIRLPEVGAEEFKKKLKTDVLENIKKNISEIQEIKIDKGRIFLKTKKDSEKALKNIYGILSFSPSEKYSLKNLNQRILLFAKILKNKKTFAIKIKRIGKHKFKSQDLAAEIGEKIINEFPRLKVDLKNPEETIFVEIRGNECYIFNRIISGKEKSLESKTIDTKVLPKFVVDDMLGKLAKRLRLLGFDVVYPKITADSMIVKISKEENRIILTRDNGIARIKGLNVILIKSKKLDIQIKEVFQKGKFPLNKNLMFTRCSVCNNPADPIEKEKIKSKVPPLIYKMFEDFTYCPKCDKVYWKGTHYEKIIQELREFVE